MPLSAPTTVPAPAPLPAPHRWQLLDALRGFAIAGILLVNSVDITRVGSDDPLLMRGDTLRQALDLGVQTRFVPIFVFLFGMSLHLILRGARRRGVRAWAPLLRRLLTLGVIGGALMLAYPGNVLIEYAIVGLLVLPFILLLPPRWLLILGLMGTIGVYAITGGGLVATPGLMMLGAAAAAFGLPRALEAGTRMIGWTAAIAAIASAGAIVWQLSEPGDPRFSTPGGIAGLTMAILYVCLLSLLWQTPARGVIAGVFEPLGRMALSNYVVAALIFAGGAAVIDFPAMTSLAPVVLMSLAVLLVQSLVSRLWLRSFAYGPLEWLWRIVTWWSPVPLRRLSAPGPVPASSSTTPLG